MADFVKAIPPIPNPKPKTFGIAPQDIANLVFGEGTLQYTQTLNGGLAISINYNAVPHTNIDAVRTKFAKNALIDFFNNTFQVLSYSESVEKFIFNGTFLFNYNVSINLESLTYLNASKSVEVDPVNGSVSSQDIANKAKFVYNGVDFIIKDVSKKESFTFTDLINQRLFQFRKFFIVENNSIKTIDLPINAIVPDRIQVSPLQADASALFRYTNITVEDISESVDPLASAPVFNIATQTINYIAEGDPNPHICPVDAWYDESGVEVLPATIGPNHPPVFGNAPPSYPNLRSLRHWVNAARLLHYNFDKNGITKTYKLTKKIGETTVEEEELTYGFIFSCYRLAVSGGNPQNYWRLVRYQKTNFIYEPLKQIGINSIIDAFDPDTGKPIKAVVDSSLFSLINANPPKYLTKIKTSGWRYARFEQENYDGSSHDIDGPPGAPSTIYWGYRYTNLNFPRVLSGTPPLGWSNWVQSNLDLSLWRKVFFEKETTYELIPKDSVFKEKPSIEFEIIKVKASNLKTNISLPVDANGFVSLAFINPNSVAQPYLIIKETTSNKDILWRKHPLNIAYNNQAKLNYNADSNINLSGYSMPTFFNPTLPPFVIGESNKTVITRKIIPNKNTIPEYSEFFGQTLIEQAPPEVSINLPIGGYKARESNTDIYLEREEISNLEVRDANFPKEVVEIVNREIQGIPPEASILQAEFVQKPSSEVPKPPTYIYSSQITTEPLNVQEEVRDETITITEENINIQLACDFFYNQKLLFDGQSYTLAYDGGEYKKYRPGQLLRYNFDNDWIIKETRLNIAFNGDIVTAESIELTLGNWFSIVSNLKPSPPATSPLSATSNTNTTTIQSLPSIVGVSYLDDRSSESPLQGSIDL